MIKLNKNFVSLFFTVLVTPAVIIFKNFFFILQLHTIEDKEHNYREKKENYMIEIKSQNNYKQ